ncbi:MAG: hypothetical protein PVH89_02380 [Gammaproteobacteria bacterium]|jgi:hypothetical protein
MKHANAVVPALIAWVALGLVPGTQPVAQEAEQAEDSTAAARAIEELTAAYEALTGMLGESSDEAVERVQSDMENLGDWEYHVVELAVLSTEAVAEELNALGDERWEVFWVEPVPGGVRVYLKRPSVSYLSRVPLTALIRLLAAGA